MGFTVPQEDLSFKEVSETHTTIHLPFPGPPAEPPHTHGLIVLGGYGTYLPSLIGECLEALQCGVGEQAVRPDR